MNQIFKTQIGLEVHVQLKTKSKMFCGCDNQSFAPAFAEATVGKKATDGKRFESVAPNSNVCPICMGMPGTLPVANRSAIEMTVKTGLALGCKIPKVSKFDRKHYFYPDLPKGYQISQYDMPFCLGGKTGLKEIRLNRIHLEEDAGKLTHPENSYYSTVDLNRAGTPLMEIVTEPDIESPAEAKEFLKALHEILRCLDVSDADMEKGHLRCDANISIVKSENKSQRMSEIVEIKNINSFKFVEKALTYEERRLIDKYPDWPKKMKKVTHGFDSKTGTTFSLREKEEAKDYRYFPEPDLPPFEFSNKEVELIKKDLPILPSHGRQRYLGLGISEDQAKAIFGNSEWRILFDRLLELEPMFAPDFARLIINEPLSRDKPPEFIFSLVKMIKEKSLTSNIVRDILSSGDLKKATGGVANADELVLQIVRLNPNVCAKYLSGKIQVLGFLVGQVMKSSQGGLDAAKVRDKIIKMIEENQDGK